MAGIIPADRVVYGMQLPIQSQSTIYREAWEPGSGATDLAAVARACDRNGFFYVAVCDHVAVPRPLDEKMGTEWWDTVATLGWLAGITEHVHLLSHVYVLPYRHPLQSGKAFATLDALSGGRAILGVGAGHVEGEFDLLGVDFADRGPLLDEAIDAVRACFAEEYPSFDGPTWSAGDAGQRPRPVRSGGPPIWVGGSSAPAMRRAADRGDGWLPQGPPKQGMAAAIADLRERRAAAGKGDERFDIGINTAPIYVGAPPFDVEAWTITGTGDAIAAKLRKHAATGANQLQLRFRSRSVDELVDQIEAFGADVAPLLND